MKTSDSKIKCAKGLISLVNQIETVTYGSNMIPYLQIEGYGTGAEGLSLLKEELGKINLELSLEQIDLLGKPRKLAEEIKTLEEKMASLSTIFGENGGAEEGTLAYGLLKKMEDEISEYKIERTRLKTEIEKADDEYAKKIEDIDKKTKEAIVASTKKISDANEEAGRKVKLIEQFSDFLSETNENMRLYSWVIILVIVAVGTAVCLSIPDLLDCFVKYNEFISKLGTKASSWQILNFAFGILIVKLPWALCLSAVFTGMYKLLKGLLHTYEKINQDKRNMSAIYSVSGNIVQALNEYGLSIVEESDDPESGQVTHTISKSKDEIERKRETLRWNQIINYFERMQSHKVEDSKEDKDESSQLEFFKNLVNKVIDKGLSKV